MQFASSKPESFTAKYEEVELPEVFQQRMKIAQAQPKLQTRHPEVCSVHLGTTADNSSSFISCPWENITHFVGNEALTKSGGGGREADSSIKDRFVFTFLQWSSPV